MLIHLNACVFYRLQEGKEYLLKSIGLWLPAQKQSTSASSTEEGVQVSWRCACVFF